jgi:hypothetical protein
MSAGSVASPYAVTEPNNETACFSVAEIATDELVGEALLWGIDTHSRAANVGISLRPSFEVVPSLVGVEVAVPRLRPAGW